MKKGHLARRPHCNTVAREEVSHESATSDYSCPIDIYTTIRDCARGGMGIWTFQKDSKIECEIARLGLKQSVKSTVFLLVI